MASSDTSSPASGSQNPPIVARKSTKPSSASNTPSLFTPQMQERQARDKDPYASSSGSEDDLYHKSVKNGGYEAAQARREAAIILDSPELLLMHAQARSDSVSGTRYHFTKMLCGYKQNTAGVVNNCSSSASASASNSRSTMR